MISKLATNTMNTKFSHSEQTEFQLHKSQISAYSSIQNIIDYTEKKLIKYTKSVTDAQQKLVLLAILKDYLEGTVAISWKKGKPIYLRITKEV